MSHREQHHAALHSYYVPWYILQDTQEQKPHKSMLFTSRLKKHTPRRYREKENKALKIIHKQTFNLFKYLFLLHISSPEYVMYLLKCAKDGLFIYSIVQDCINEGLVNPSYVYNISQDKIKIIHNKNAINTAGKKWLKNHVPVIKNMLNDNLCFLNQSPK